MNILKALSHQSCGLDKHLLLRVGTSLVGSRLDYGSELYGSATKTTLKMLELVLNLGLCLASGAFRTCPVQSLHVECDKWSLDNQRTYTDLLYTFNVSSLANHPFKPVISDTTTSQLHFNRPSIPDSLSHRARDEAPNLGVTFSDTCESSLFDLLPPWKLRAVSCGMSFIAMNRKRVPATAILQQFLYLREKCRCAEFFSDASKTSLTGSCAAHGPDFRVSESLNSTSSIFTAEAHGVLLVLKHIVQHEIPKSVIFTD